MDNTPEVPKVVSINPDCMVPQDRQIHPELVEMLEDALAKAKCGEMQSAALAYTFADKTPLYWVVGPASYGLSGALSAAQSVVNEVMTS